MSINKDVICHAEGDRCHGCDHYWGRAPVCVFAPKQTPVLARGTETPRTKNLFDGIKARRNARGFHMPQDIDDAEESHAKLERELSSANEQIAALHAIREKMETASDALVAKRNERIAKHEQIIAAWKREEEAWIERERVLMGEIAALRGALKPFANYACEPPCECHNCKARAALAATRKDSNG